MRNAGAVALRTGFPVFPCRLQIVARRRSLFVDAARGVAPDFAAQRQATRFGAFGTVHDHAMGVELDREFRGHDATTVRISLQPMKGNTKVGAAGTAAQAW